MELDKTLIELAVKYGELMDNNEFKNVDEVSEEIFRLSEILKTDSENVRAILPLLNNENIWVRRFTAQLLLPYFTEKAIETLQFISLSENLASLQAQAVIVAWEKNNKKKERK